MFLRTDAIEFHPLCYFWNLNLAASCALNKYQENGQPIAAPWRSKVGDPQRTYIWPVDKGRPVSVGPLLTGRRSPFCYRRAEGARTRIGVGRGAYFDYPRGGSRCSARVGYGTAEGGTGVGYRSNLGWL